MQSSRSASCSMTPPGCYPEQEKKKMSDFKELDGHLGKKRSLQNSLNLFGPLCSFDLRLRRKLWISKLISKKFLPLARFHLIGALRSVEDEAKSLLPKEDIFCFIIHSQHLKINVLLTWNLGQSREPLESQSWCAQEIFRPFGFIVVTFFIHIQNSFLACWLCWLVPWHMRKACLHGTSVSCLPRCTSGACRRLWGLALFCSRIPEGQKIIFELVLTVLHQRPHLLDIILA